MGKVRREYVFCDSAQDIMTSPDPVEIEYDNTRLEQKPHYWPETASPDLSSMGIRLFLELERHVRDLALFNKALDSKLRGCDLVKLNVSDVAYGHSVSGRAAVLQQKMGIPV